jgi:type VI secretion system secreted protein Hcp
MQGKDKTMTRFHTMTAIAAALVFAWAAGSAQAAVFAKYDGIDGESKDANHDKWIDILAIDWGSHKPGGGATGQSRRRGDVKLEDITVTKELDKATPKLHLYCVEGRNAPVVRFDEYTKNEEGTDGYYIIRLVNVRVSSYSVSGAASGEPLPTETISLNFEKITYKFVPLGPPAAAEGDKSDDNQAKAGNTKKAKKNKKNSKAKS